MTEQHARAPEIETLAAQGRAQSLGPKLAVSLIIALGFFWVLRQGGLPMFPAISAFSHLQWWAAPAYLVLYCACAWLRTYRWYYLLRPLRPGLSARRVMGIGLVGFTAIVFAPLRMGEIVRPWLLSQDGEIGFMQATGTVAAERVVDGLALTLLLGVGLLTATPLSPLPTQVGRLPMPVAAVPSAATAALVLFSGAFALLIAFYFFRDAARRFTHATVGLISQRLADWGTQKVEQLAAGLRFLPSRRDALPFVRDTLLYWAVCSLSTWVLLRGCGLDADAIEALVIMGIMGIGTLIPSGPGFFGAYQFSAYCGLAMFFPESQILSAGAVFIFISYTAQVVMTAASCPLGLWLMITSRKPDAVGAGAPDKAARAAL